MIDFGLPSKNAFEKSNSKWPSFYEMDLDDLNPSECQIRKLLRISTAVRYRIGPKLEGVVGETQC